jgi:hypothetical protein
LNINGVIQLEPAELIDEVESASILSFDAGWKQILLVVKGIC